jgi:hypothetical protein
MNEPKLVLYRGVHMIEGWPDKIQTAQNMLSYTLNGKPVSRVRYGDEQDEWHADAIPCRDCRVLKSELHVPECDVEECPVCGGQLISCDCDFEERKGQVRGTVNQVSPGRAKDHR